MTNSLKSSLYFTLCLGLTAGCAVAGGKHTPTTGKTSLSSQTGYTAATELQWVDSGFGPLVSPVNGDFSKSRHITYVKFPAGMATPTHTHTHDYVGVVITGVSMHWEPGKPETKKPLSAGAHWFMPGGVQHVSECLPGAECIMAIYQQQSMDFLPVQ
ncbi:MAG: DUF4437 domain-containing protein [Burkholderiaceae bacterium]